MIEKFFEGVKYEEVDVQGRIVRFPVRYIDQTRISVTLTASTERVRKALPSVKLEPVEINKGTTTISLMAFEYREIDSLSPYNEFGTFVPVLCKAKPDDSGLPGVFCFHLPVTTERARFGGVEIYGFPKFVAEITFKDLGDSLSCHVWHDGKDIATIRVRKIEAATRKWVDYCYTVRNGRILRTFLQAHGLVGTSNLEGGASIELGSHPVAEELRQLEIGQSPIQYSYMPKVQSLLHRPSENFPI
nr:acetoacetate decarboxylase family protein [Candidatus Njordarchaeum guaymaensis]